VAKTIDSGAGFFIEEETAEDEQQEKRVVQQPGDQKWHRIHAHNCFQYPF